MVTEINFEIKGLKEMDALLKELPDELAEKVIKDATRAGANLIKKEAQARVPVKSGRLQKSIRAIFDKDAFNKFGSIRYVVTSRVPYVHLVEYGTSGHEIKTKGAGINLLTDGSTAFGSTVQHPGAKAKPFLRPAVDSRANEAIQLVGKRLQKGLVRVAKQLAGKHKTRKR